MYGILLVITTAGEERSISKLKLIKTYLRTAMSQDNFYRLGTLSIENDIAKNFFGVGN